MATRAKMYNTDRLKLLEIFPEELWLTIFDKIKDFETFSNLRCASPYFDELLRQKINEFLFSKVLPILDKQKLVSNQSAQALMKCRLVCKNWKHSVDQLLEYRPYHSKFADVKLYSVGFLRHGLEEARPNFLDDVAYPTWFSVFKCNNLELLDEIISVQKVSLFQNECITPSRHVDIMESDNTHYGLQHNEVVLQNYRDLTINLLTAIGSEFWHARIEVHKFLTVVEWYALLRKYAKLMPNLKTLRIYPPNVRDINPEDLNALHNFVQHKSFPQLRNLKVINLERYPSCVLNAILGANPHIETIEIRDSRNSEFSLKIEQAIYPRCFNISVKSVKELVAIPDSWKLEKLKLDINENFDEPICWQMVFGKLEVFKNSLIELVLDLPSGHWNDTTSNLKASKSKLRLPHLKILKVKVSDNCCIDFLLGLKSLEYLKIRDKWQKGKEIDLDCKNLSSALESNIWSKLPNLTKLRVKTFPWRRLESFQRIQLYIY